MSVTYAVAFHDFIVVFVRALVGQTGESGLAPTTSAYGFRTQKDTVSSKLSVSDSCLWRERDRRDGLVHVSRARTQRSARDRQST